MAIRTFAPAVVATEGGPINNSRSIPSRKSAWLPPCRLQAREGRHRRDHRPGPSAQVQSQIPAVFMMRYPGYHDDICPVPGFWQIAPTVLVCQQLL